MTILFPLKTELYDGLVSKETYLVNNNSFAVFKNEVMSCHYSNSSNTIFCANNQYYYASEYVDVDMMLFCNYHTCFTLKDDPRTILCSGLVFDFSGSGNENLKSPLGPDIQVPSVSEENVNMGFGPWNIMVDRFEKDTSTSFNSDIVKMSCHRTLSTCINLMNSSKEICFGAADELFFGEESSFGLGVSVSLLSIVIPALFLWCFCFNKNIIIAGLGYMLAFFIVPFLSAIWIYFRSHLSVHSISFWAGVFTGQISTNLIFLFITKYYELNVGKHRTDKDTEEETPGGVELSQNFQLSLITPVDTDMEESLFTIDDEEEADEEEADEELRGHFFLQEDQNCNYSSDSDGDDIDNASGQLIDK